MESKIIQIFPRPDFKELDKIAKGQQAFYKQHKLGRNGRPKLSPKY